VNGRPKSYGAMLKSVAAAKWPKSTPPTRAEAKLWPVLKHMLTVMSQQADQNTGGRVQISNAMLREKTSYSERYIRENLRVLEFDLLLITNTGHRKGGRRGRGRNAKGIAPEYQINLTNPAFPEYTVNGECLVVGGTETNLKGAQNKAVGGTDCAVPGTKPFVPGTESFVGGTHRGTLSTPPSQDPATPTTPTKPAVQETDSL
jgi:hypothetical protein